MRTISSPYNYRLGISGGDLRQALHEIYTAITELRGMEMTHTKAYCREIREVSAWLDGGCAPWLVMSGGVGTGKTTMLASIVRLYTLYGDCRSEGIRRGVEVMDAADITTLYTRNYDGFDNLRRAPMLAIDDLGVENVEVHSYGNITTPVTELLSHRYERRLLTIISTNLPPRIIGERYGERIADRMRECAQVVLFPGRSYRRKT